MSNKKVTRPALGRRSFLGDAGKALATGVFGGLAASTLAQEAKPESIAVAGAARLLTDKEKAARIASNTWPIRSLF